MTRPRLCLCLDQVYYDAVGNFNAKQSMGPFCAHHYGSDLWHALERRETKRQTDGRRAWGDFSFQLSHLVQVVALQLLEASQS